MNKKLGVLLVDVPETSAFLYTYIVEEKLFGNSVYTTEMSNHWEDVIKNAYKYTEEEAKKYPQFRWVPTVSVGINVEEIEMNTELMNELKELLGSFPRSYINANMEVILIPRTNTYFSLEGVESRRDIVAKLLMWCSWTISENKSKAFRAMTRISLNRYLETRFSDDDMALIYQRLGNGINPELTYRFIDSGFNMDVLDD